MVQTSKPEKVTLTHDWNDDVPLSYSTVNALSQAMDADVEDIPFLERSISAEALDELFGAPGTPPDTRGSLVFRHANHRITIRTDGEIEVAPLPRTE